MVEKEILLKLTKPKEETVNAQDKQKQYDVTLVKKTPGLLMNSLGVGFSFIGFVISGVMTALTGSLFQQIMLVWFSVMLMGLSFLLGNKLRHKYKWK